MLKSSPRAFRQSLRIEFCEATENDCAVGVALPAVLLLTAFSAASAKPQFQETALFAGAQQGIYTYRIPSMISTRKGTTLVSCEGRRYDRSPMQSSSSGVSETPALQTRSERSTSRPRPMQDMKIVWQPMQIRPNSGYKPKVTRLRH